MDDNRRLFIIMMMDVKPTWAISLAVATVTTKRATQDLLRYCEQEEKKRVSRSID